MAPEDPKQVTAELWDALENLRSERICLANKDLFRSGESSRGVYLVEEGEVRLFLSSASGRERLAETVGPGAILGLSEAMSGEAHKLTAQASGKAQVSFVLRPDLINFLRKNPAFCMQLVRLLSENLHTLYHRFMVESVAASRSRKNKGQNSASQIGLRHLNLDKADQLNFQGKLTDDYQENFRASQVYGSLKITVTCVWISTGSPLR